MKKQPLTDKQQEVLDFIKGYIDENGLSPSWSAIADRFDTGVENVRRYLNALTRKGHISKDTSTRPPAITVL